MDAKYLNANKALWNARVSEHVNSDFYQNESFMAGRNALNNIELEILGDVKGLKILHLQCHFGQDSLSLARMGAQVTGVDFSEEAIAQAQKMNHDLGLDAKFVCCNVLEIHRFLNEKYDLIFTSYGTIGWIPDLKPYFKNVAQFLKTGGQFLIVDFHPVFWMFDENFKEIAFSYFNSEVIVEAYEGSYASAKANQKMPEYGWNHPTSEVISNLLNSGLQINLFEEYPYSPYDLFKESTATKNGFMIKGLENKMPLVFALRGIKN